MEQQKKKFEWSFPFEPYPIQRAFMSDMYDTLDSGKVGIFESPTGTGKSLSLICSALFWLKSYRGKLVQGEVAKMEQAGEIRKTSGPLWIQSFREKKLEEEQSLAERRQAERRARVEENRRLGSMRQYDFSKKKHKTKYAKPVKAKTSEESDEEFAPDYDPGAWSNQKTSKDFYSSSSESDEEDQDGVGDEEDLGLRKIYFCSRTHSQLSQFMNEIGRTSFARDIPCVALGSRKQLCTNEMVRSLGSMNKINDKCLDLVDQARGSDSNGNKKTAKKKSLTETNKYLEGAQIPTRSACPRYDKAMFVRLKDEVLSEAQDIEAIADLATQYRACGYYLSRASMKDAEVVVLPYSMLLHKKTRESLGISLKGNVVIFDEAHNVIEAINDIHSSVVQENELKQALAELTEYEKRYRARLKPENRVHIKNLVCLVKRLCELLEKQDRSKDQVFSAGKITIDANIDHINLFEILQYVEKAQLCKKLGGFAEKYLQSQVAIHPKPGSPVAPNSEKRRRSSASSLFAVERFLQGITNLSEDGKVVISFDTQTKQFRIKFLLLNPGVYFRDIVDEAHSIILAGGTMRPTEDVEVQLFGHLPKEKIHLFSCGHVIPRENMFCCVVSQGPTKKPLELSFQNRSNPIIMDEIGFSLINICTAIPKEGIVVFLPSYKYANELFAQWTKSGTWKRLQAKKTIFTEPKHSGDTEKLLNQYAEVCRNSLDKDSTSPGAIMFSVVNGKLSEGINFKDELARCVVMVGLPYPDPNSAEMKVKMAYLDQQKGRHISSKEYYENQCMKAVNQCIGRAIRHQNDYSSVVLLDGRYARPNIRGKLPNWIAQDMVCPPTFPECYKNLRAFYNNHKK